MSNEITKLPTYQEPANLDDAKTRIIQLGRNMGEHAYIIGKILIWVKSQLEHGEFLKWTEKNVWFVQRTAQRFMGFSAKCDDEQKLLNEPHYLEKEKSDNLSHYKPEFNLIDMVDKQIKEVTNWKMMISEERTGLTIVAPMTPEEWDASFEIIKELPVNPDVPISRLEGLACFLIADWFLYYEKIETALKAFCEIEKLYPKLNAYICDKKNGQIDDKKLQEVRLYVEQRIKEKAKGSKKIEGEMTECEKKILGLI